MEGKGGRVKGGWEQKGEKKHGGRGVQGLRLQATTDSSATEEEMLIPHKNRDLCIAGD